MGQRRSAFLAAVLGLLGAALAMVLLLVSQTGGTLPGDTKLITEQLPILVVGAGGGFVAGVMVAVIWSIARWLFAPHVPRA